MVLVGPLIQVELIFMRVNGLMEIFMGMVGIYIWDTNIILGCGKMGKKMGMVLILILLKELNKKDFGKKIYL